MRTVEPSSWWPGRRVGLRRGAARALGEEAVLRRAMLAALREWAAHCNLPGVRTKNNQRDPWERLLLRIFAVLCFVWWLVWLATTWVARGDRGPAPAPTLADPLHPARAAPFPAIALCSYNLLSLKALKEFAEYLARLEGTDDADWKIRIIKELQGFGALIALDPFVFYNNILEDVLDKIPSREFNVTDILARLSPQCGDILQDCRWRGEARRCQDLFQLRPTGLGYCCVFNGRYMPEDMDNPPEILDAPGLRHGLAVRLQEDPGDFAYIRKPVNGFEVLVFPGENYPAAAAGGVLTQAVPRGRRLLLRLARRLQRPSPHMRRTAKQAGCHIYSGSGELRSHGRCVAGCRRRAASALCACVPLAALPDAADTGCTPADLACLNKHRGKFRYFRPSTAQGAALLEERQHGLDCGCRPDCARAAYSLRALDLTPNSAGMKQHLANESTWLCFYYKSIYHELYDVEPHYRTTHGFGHWSSLCVCVTAWSLLLVAELLYFCSLRFVTHLLRARRIIGQYTQLQRQY